MDGNIITMDSYLKYLHQSCPTQAATPEALLFLEILLGGQRGVEGWLCKVLSRKIG